MDHLTLAFSEGIASAQMAAAIKFGLEGLPDVRAVHFQAEGVEVITESAATSTDALLEVLASAGIEPGNVEVLRERSQHPTREQT